jgi:hypothetical protein
MTDEAMNQTDTSASPLTVTDLASRVEAARADLSQITAFLDDLVSWVASLPEHHRPAPDPTLVSAFASGRSADPLTLERETLDFFSMIERVSEAADRARRTVVTEAGLFGFPQAGRGPRSARSDGCFPSDSSASVTRPAHW